MEHPDIGFAFLPEFEKNGYAFEATLSVLNRLALEAMFTKVLAVTVPANTRSISLLNRLGLEYVNDIEVGNEVMKVFEISADLVLLNSLCLTFFSVFNNTDQKNLDLKKLSSICIPQAIFISNIKGHYLVSDLLRFISTRQKMLTDGTLVNFQEQEIRSNTIIVKHTAHRLSKYEKNWISNGTSIAQKGTKMIQFIKDRNTWRISSVVWEDIEATDVTTRLTEVNS